MSKLSEWLGEMVGKQVEVETDDNMLTGRLDEITEDPTLSLKMSSVTDADDEPLGTTVVSWCAGYRMSLTDD